jgi:hypothetical protein
VYVVCGGEVGVRVAGYFSAASMESRGGAEDGWIQVAWRGGEVKEYSDKDAIIMIMIQSKSKVV